MAQITSYGTLKTEIANGLHRSDLTSDVPFFIQLAENRIYRELRVRQMETTFSSAISSGVISVPTGYVELKVARISSTSPTRTLQRKDAEWIYSNYPTRSSDAMPQFIARDGASFIFGPYPDSAYTVAGTYYKRLSALSDSNATNWLTDDCPDLIYYAALCEAAPWLRDDSRIPVWERKYEIIKSRVQGQDNDEEFSGSPLSATLR